MVAIFLVISFLFFYFIPFIVAHERRHRNYEAIGALNALLGWTVLGWIAALVWALTDNKRGGRYGEEA